MNNYMINVDDLFPIVKDKDISDKHITVVRVSTSYWNDSNGIYQKKSIKTLKRKSFGYDILTEDASIEGAESIFPRIINLNDVKDGVYQVIIVNAYKDWETGYVDDYDYKLIKYVQEA